MRFITKGIDKELPKDLIYEMWNMYDDGYERTPKDTMQVFETYKLPTGLIGIKMSQEEPRACIAKSSVATKFVKVWIIDDGENETMLFPEEY